MKSMRGDGVVKTFAVHSPAYFISSVVGNHGHRGQVSFPSLAPYAIHVGHHQIIDEPGEHRSPCFSGFLGIHPVNAGQFSSGSFTLRNWAGAFIREWFAKYPRIARI